MADIEWLVEQIENSPEGPQIGAFFDFDGTLIAGYSAAAFFTYRLQRREISVREIVRPSPRASTSSAAATTSPS